MSQPHHRFIAAGPAAQHCPELLARGVDPADLIERWRELGDNLAIAMARLLAPVLDDTLPDIEVSTELVNHSGLAACALIVRTGLEGSLQLTIEGTAVLQMVDRAFGGTGAAPVPTPSTFPPSAHMMITRLELMVLETLAEIFGCQSDEFAVRLRSHSIAALPLRPGSSSVLTFTIREPSKTPWTVTIGLPDAVLPAWLGAAPRRATAERRADPAAAPFGELPLRLTARLVDMRLPFGTLAQLEPGKVLPVAVTRAVPLEANGLVIAHGTVGHQDDRIALKLTKLA